MSHWDQVPKATKIYLVIIAYLVFTLCGLITIREYKLVPERFSPKGFSNLLVRDRLETQTPESDLKTPTFSIGENAAWMRAKTNLRVMDGPGESYTEIAWLEDNQLAEIIGSSEDGLWWAIQLPYFSSGKGWVRKDGVEANRTEYVPIITPVAADLVVTPTKEDLAKARAIANINIRSGPDLRFQKIGTLENERTATIVGVSPDHFWFLIRIPGNENIQGWISRDYVIAQNADDVPIIGENKESQTQISTSSPYLLAKAVVNVRSGPDVSFTVIGQLNQGELAEIVGKTADGKWWIIKYSMADGGKGWVSSAYVDAKNAEKVQVSP